MTENTALIPVQLQVTVTPAKVEHNIAPLKAALVKKIDDQSNIVITLENVKEGKEVAAEINKTKSALAGERKRVVSEASVDVKAFDAAAKELEAICDEGYRKLKDQTDKFDEAKTKEHLQIIKDALAAAWEAAGIEPEFRRAVVDDLASLTAVTPKGSLTKATKTPLDSRVAEDKARQDMVEKRLLKLENESFRAGLVSPLDRSHVAAFLFGPDDVYQRHLDAILQKEVERQQAAQDRARNDQLAEQARAAQQAQAKQVDVVHQATIAAAPEQYKAACDDVLIGRSTAQNQNHQPAQNLGAQLKVNHPAFGAEQKDQFGAALNGVQQGKPMTCTQSEFEQHVIGLSSAADGFFEIYSRSSGLVSIVKNGVLFRKVEA